MDYGQSTQSDNNQPFFTADSGTNAEKPHTAEDDLNSKNWDISTDRDPSRIGNTAIASSEISSDSVSDETIIDNQDSNEVVNPSLMPPDFVPEEASIPTEEPIVHTQSVDSDGKDLPARMENSEAQYKKDAITAAELTNSYHELKDQKLQELSGHKVGEQP